MTRCELDAFMKRQEHRRRLLGPNTLRTPEVLARDRADELEELSWVSLAQVIRRGQCC